MTKRLKILMVADGHGGAIYDEALADGFVKLGHKVERFTWKEYFHNYPYANAYPTDGNKVRSFWYRLQNRLMAGPAVFKLNRALVAHAKTLQPDMVFLYRGTHVWPCTLKALRKVTHAKIAGYNNDDPFSPRYPWYFWRHFKRGLRHYDHMFSFRHKNLKDYAETGYRRTSLLRSYYIDKLNHPVAKRDKRFACDVIFVGHFEDDGRDVAIKTLVDAGIDLKLYGTGWQKSPLYGFFRERFGEIRPLYGPDYNLSLASGRMALVFLSKLNNDTYTQRTFEIPATGTVMVSEYTKDMAGMFAADEEAVYFRTPAELLAKVKGLLAEPKRLAAIGKAGRARLLKDGHEVTDRARQVLETLGLV
jgi:spore maturation protein CgeB